MELTKEHIQRINNFLEAIGLEYADIRFEMVDHIASEIETKVDDIPAFFAYDGLQTPFFKYMMSRKIDLFNQYEKQLKRGWFLQIVNVLKDSYKQLFIAKNVLVLFSILILFYIGAQQNIVYIILTIKFITYALSMCYIHLMNKFLKDYSKLKITRIYRWVIGFGGFCALVFPFGVTNFTDAPYTFIHLYILMLVFSFTFLVLMSYLQNKNTIESKYQFLIQ